MVVLCLSIEYGIKRNIEVMEYRDGADLGEGGRGGRGGGGGEGFWGGRFFPFGTLKKSIFGRPTLKFF